MQYHDLNIILFSWIVLYRDLNNFLNTLLINVLNSVLFSADVGGQLGLGYNTLCHIFLSKKCLNYCPEWCPN